MTPPPLIVFAGGGSGGHLYPSLAVADKLTALVPTLRLVFFGTDRAIDARVLDSRGCEWIRQRVRPVPRWPWQIPGFLKAWRASTLICRQFLRDRRPVAVLGSGGFASAPPVCEAARAGIPTALMNPDAVPGKANRFLGSRVGTVFAQWPETAGHFNGSAEVRVTGCPVRPEFGRAGRSDGIEHFGLDPVKRVLLVTGASQGARSVNRAVLAILPELARRGVWDRWQVLHLTGREDESEVAAAYRSSVLDGQVRVVGFTQHMAVALAAADLVLCRAGASTLAEVTALGKPSVLMPYPYHRDRHQVANARVLVKLGAARMVLDQADPQAGANATGTLADTLTRLMTDDAELARLAGSARRAGTTNAADAIAQHLLELAGVAQSSSRAEWMEKPCGASR